MTNWILQLLGLRESLASVPFHELPLWRRVVGVGSLAVALCALALMFV